MSRITIDFYGLEEPMRAYQSQFNYQDFSEAIRELVRMGLIAAANGRGFQFDGFGTQSISQDFEKAA